MKKMAAAFQTTKGDLADRLLAVLLVGDEAGGDSRGKQSVGLLVVTYYIEVPPYLFVHAGIRPDVPLHQQSVADLTEIREPFFQSRLTTEYTVVFGHTPTYKLGVEPGGIWIEKGRIGIDTGAKHGYRLTLLDLTGGSVILVPQKNRICTVISKLGRLT